MSATIYHPEDVRAELKKRHGTLGAFSEARGLRPQQVADWLRGRTSAAVAQKVAAELGVDEVHLESRQSMKMDDSAADGGTHRLNAGAR